MNNSTPKWAYITIAMLTLALAGMVFSSYTSSYEVKALGEQKTKFISENSKIKGDNGKISTELEECKKELSRISTECQERRQALASAQHRLSSSKNVKKLEKILEAQERIMEKTLRITKNRIAVAKNYVALRYPNSKERAAKLEEEVRRVYKFVMIEGTHKPKNESLRALYLYAKKSLEYFIAKAKDKPKKLSLIHI